MVQLQSALSALPFISGYSLILVPGCPISETNYRHSGCWPSLSLSFEVNLAGDVEAPLNKAEMQIDPQLVFKAKRC